MKDIRPLNRREFFERAALLGALAAGGATLLAACEASPREETPTVTNDNGEFSCDDPSDLQGLSEAQLQTREANNYVDRTPNPDQRCDNCALWQDPAAGANCGGCTVVAGPIHPGGWCSIWVPAS
jgi:hypothetical protein